MNRVYSFAPQIFIILKKRGILFDIIRFEILIFIKIIRLIILILIILIRFLNYQNIVFMSNLFHICRTFQFRFENKLIVELLIILIINFRKWIVLEHRNSFLHILFLWMLWTIIVFRMIWLQSHQFLVLSKTLWFNCVCLFIMKNFLLKYRCKWRHSAFLFKF